MAVAIRDDKNDRIPVIENNDFHTFSNYLSVPFSETEKILKVYNMSLATNPTLVKKIFLNIIFKFLCLFILMYSNLAHFILI